MAKNESDLYFILKKCQTLLNIAIQYQSYMHSAFLRMTLARTMVMLGKFKIDEIKFEFNKAVEDIYKEGNIILTPVIELVCIDFYRQQGNIKQAQEKLEHILDNVILPCGMNLWEADARLLEANIYLDLEDTTYFGQAQQSYERAKELIYTSKYGLRTTELSLLAARIYSKNLVKFNKYLKKAEQHIQEIGQWGLQDNLKKLQNKI